jgi:DMSO/TMAO reductase YedYZ molybdopterin-dependent catalytic subunit
MERVAALVALLCLFGGCLSGGARELSGVEVKDYNGEKLGSVDDFHENSIKGPQYVNISVYRLEVSGLVERPQSFTYDDVLVHQHYSKVVELDCVEGWSVKVLWEGVLVRDLLAKAKAKPQVNTIIFYAVDGYSTSFPLDYVLKNDILLAYNMNNVTIPPERGFPFELVAENKWGYKWIKWVSKIELSNDPGYKGYWEQRGYSQVGDRDQPMFD